MIKRIIKLFIFIKKKFAFFFQIKTFQLTTLQFHSGEIKTVHSQKWHKNKVGNKKAKEIERWGTENTSEIKALLGREKPPKLSRVEIKRVVETKDKQAIQIHTYI